MAITDETLALAADARRRMLTMTDEQVRALARAWVDAWDTLAPQLQASVEDMLQQADGQVSYATAAKNQRLAAALRQAREMLNELEQRTGEIITRDLPEATRTAVDSAVAVGQSQLPANAAAIGVQFERVDPLALDNIVARTTERIHSATKPLSDMAERAMKQALVRGVAVGSNPFVTARNMVRQAEGGFNGGLTRAANIARTETLDAYRAAALTSSKQNADLLVGWQWFAQLDARTCPSCLAQHGQLHDVDVAGPEDHQQGRCARVDKTKSWRELGFDIPEPPDAFPDARAWFDNLTPETQRAIMGPTRLAKLQAGDIGWDDLSRKVSTPGWRDSYHVTPVKNL